MQQMKCQLQILQSRCTFLQNKDVFRSYSAKVYINCKKQEFRRTVMENTNGIITFPSVYMHTSPDIYSEVSDEIIYGTTVRKIAKSGEWYRCETDYGYSGYLNSRYISTEENTNGASPFVVIAPFADLYTDSVYRYRPVVSLPKGSIIYSRHSHYRNDRFFQVIHRGHKCFIPSHAVKPLERREQVDASEAGIIRKKICDDALMYLGSPYRWGGKTPSGIDCSGLCFMSYFLNGLPL
ncbi:MAG: C40 family peptidase, partial [Clostridia bacterium]|nr:C40 family peptidase [Clostridia bacterium]